MNNCSAEGCTMETINSFDKFFCALFTFLILGQIMSMHLFLNKGWALSFKEGVIEADILTFRETIIKETEFLREDIHK